MGLLGSLLVGMAWANAFVQGPQADFFDCAAGLAVSSVDPDTQAQVSGDRKAFVLPGSVGEKRGFFIYTPYLASFVESPKTLRAHYKTRGERKVGESCEEALARPEVTRDEDVQKVRMPISKFESPQLYFVRTRRTGVGTAMSIDRVYATDDANTWKVSNSYLEVVAKKVRRSTNESCENKLRKAMPFLPPQAPPIPVSEAQSRAALKAWILTEGERNVANIEARVADAAAQTDGEAQEDRRTLLNRSFRAFKFCQEALHDVEIERLMARVADTGRAKLAATGFKGVIDSAPPRSNPGNPVGNASVIEDASATQGGSAIQPR